MHMPQGTLLTNCSVVDVANGSVASNAGVPVQDNCISAVGPITDVRSQAPDATVVDLAGAHVLPGRFNRHVDFDLILLGLAGDSMQDETEAALALRMAQNAREALLSG